MYLYELQIEPRIPILTNYTIKSSNLCGSWFARNVTPQVYTLYALRFHHLIWGKGDVTIITSYYCIDF